jgi:hypothetical protein
MLELKIGQIFSHSLNGRLQLVMMDEKTCYFVNKAKDAFQWPRKLVELRFDLSRNQTLIFKDLNKLKN